MLVCLALLTPPAPLAQSLVGTSPAPQVRPAKPNLVFRDFGLSLAANQPGQTLGRRALALASESAMGIDLNQDGDTTDGDVLQVIDLIDGTLANSGLATRHDPVAEFLAIDPANPGHAVIEVPEVKQGGLDLNGDGDALDQVFFDLDLDAGAVRSSGLAASAEPLTALLTGSRAALWIDETAQGSTDLDGDGRLGLDLFTWDLSSANPPAGTGVAPSLLLAADGSDFLIGMNEIVAHVDLNGDGEQSDQFVLHVYHAANGSLVNLGLSLGPSPVVRARGGHAAFLADESSQNASLNGDGDRNDRVVHVYDFGSGEVTNLGLAYGQPSANFGGGSILVARGGLALNDDWLAFHVDEVRQGASDLNVDGDASDHGVMFVYRFSTGTLRDLELSAFDFDLGDDVLVMQVSELDQNADLDGNGEIDGHVVHAHDLAADATWNMGLRTPALPKQSEFRPRGGWIALTASEAGTDETGDGDGQDDVLVLADVTEQGLVQTGLALELLGPNPHVRFDGGGAVTVLASEARTGRDLDGDGDQLESVLQVLYPERGLALNTGASATQLMPGCAQRFPFVANEHDEGVDRNGDGDALDLVLRRVTVRLP